MNYLRASAWGCALLMQVDTALAQTVATTDLDPVVVTASRLPQRLIDTLRHTTVLTAEDIRASHAPDLPTLLRQQAGIEITQTGGIGTQSSLFLRGANSNQTLVLLDGQRIDSATTGATAVDQIMLADIERIEIVRGNVSALYGSSAIGGVVQIFTRKAAAHPSGEVAAGGGSYNTRSLRAAYGGVWGDTRLHAGLAWRDSDGFSAARRQFIPAPFVFTPADTDRDGYENTTLTLNLAHDLASGHTVSAMVRASRGEVAYDGAFSNRSEQELDALQLVSENRLGERWHSRLMLAASRDALDSFLDATPAGRVHTRNRQADWFNTVQLNAGHTLTLGLGLLAQRVSSDQTYTRTRREVRHGSLGYLGQMGPHGLQLNARHDDYSDFGSRTTWLAGYGVQVTEGWRLTASASTAFRAPTFNEMYIPAWGGNQNLRPEKARSWEAGVQYSRGALRARLVYFDTRTRDLIVYQWPTGNVNLRRAQVEGWELSLSHALGADTTVALSLTAQDPHDADTGLPLLRRAKRLGSLSLRHAPGPWSLAVEVKASGARQDVHATTFARTRLPGYAVVNLSGGYRLSDAVSLNARIDNLFDRDYSLVHGYETSGLSGQVELVWRF
ncbi:MAG: TonB-dependent receptor [Burkholderiales bacterium]|nr:TonB-dependent receptor [Burkholderiales bacterium]